MTTTKAAHTPGPYWWLSHRKCGNYFTAVREGVDRFSGYKTPVIAGMQNWMAAENRAAIAKVEGK